MRSLALLCCLAAGACTAIGGPFGTGGAEPVPSNSTPVASAGSSLDAGSLGIYLETMEALLEGDPVQQAEVFEDAAEAAAISPTATNRLRVALALATPGHPAADPAAAQRELSRLLAAGDALLPEERILANIHLQDVEERLILDAAAQQQRERDAAQVAQANAESAERLRAAEEENRRLRGELEEAQEKLEAITSIERAIRERDDAPTVP